MLKIRLQRTGRKHEPTFRLVLTDSKNSTKSGRFLEVLGSYDPRDKNTTSIKADRVKYWISVGAKPSDTVHNFLIDKKVIEGKKINVLPQKTPIKKEGEEVAETPETPVAPVEEKTEAPVEEVKEEPKAEVVETPAEEKAPEAPVEEKAPEAPVEEAKSE